ncbi:MAG: amino acid--tRNA ligase-related protein [Candidatus Hydrogenedentota bacterium]
MDIKSLLITKDRFYASLRTFFKEQGFTEVETPVLCSSPGAEAHIEAFSTILEFNDKKRDIRYLINSPEFQMKSLLVYLDKIFQITKSFRNKEISRLHNPEFTILEWYRNHSIVQDLISDSKNLISFIFNEFHIPGPTLEIVSYDSLFEEYLNLTPSDFNSLDSLLGYLNGSGRILQSQHILKNIKNSSTLDEAINILYVNYIETILQKQKWNGIIYPFPSLFTTLSKNFLQNPALAERMELYLNGIEISNGFLEIDNYEDFINRLNVIYNYRQQNNLPIYPVDERYLELLKNNLLPPHSGIALGCDRLLMVLLGSHNIQDILPFSIAG